MNVPESATEAPASREGRAERTAPGAVEGPEPDGDQVRFDDPYWDDAFCAWWDPTLRTCC